MPGLSTGGIPVPLDTDPVGDGALSVRNLAAAIGDPWTAYNPTWTAVTTNPTLGNGTLVGAYRMIGKTMHFRIVLTVGSTTTLGNGAYMFGLPANAMTANGIQITGWVNGPNLPLVGRGNTVSNVFVYRTDTIAAIGSGSGLVSGNRIQITGTYELA